VGARYLADHPQALLADDMGLGKSAQAIRACDLVGVRDILVLCPGAVRVNWEREFERFSPMDRPCTVLRSSDDELPAGGVVVCSYDLLSPPSSAKAVKKAKKAPDDSAAQQRAKQAKRLQAKRKAFLRAIKYHRWDVLILDEAHYLKDPGAGRTTAVFGRNVTDLGIAGGAKRIWRLTGTPAPNDASELWIHLRSAGITSLSHWDFIFHFCVGFEGDFKFKIVGHKNTEELKGLLAQFMLRRKKEDVMQDLPPIRYETVTVERSAVELDPTFYEQIQAHGGEQNLITSLKVADQTLRQALEVVSANMNHGSPNGDRLKLLESMGPGLMTLRRYIGMAKLPAILDIIEDELSSGQLEKVVLFGVHQCVIEGSRKALAKYGAVTLYGLTPPQKRQRNIDKFMKDKHCRVFIGNIQAAGVGITLTSAHEVVFLEQEWVPSSNAQAAMRCHRIGQTEPVRVRIFSLHKSVDEQVQATLLRKTKELLKIF
jgi:SWI/SNF-related matrix-associated actin-dependent regulator 1 of chromatin subfamily A